jgi:ribosome-binding factor A
MSRKREGGSAAKGPTQRQLRVGEELRHVLADILRRADFRDPALLDINVTVTEVRISPDLKNATAFVIPLGGGHPDLIPALNRAALFLRGQIASEVRLQHVPRLSFQADSSFEYASKIDRLLHDPHVAQDIVRHLDGEGVPMDEAVEELLDEEEGDADAGEHADAKDVSGQKSHGA